MLRSREWLGGNTQHKLFSLISCCHQFPRIHCSLFISFGDFFKIVHDEFASFLSMILIFVIRLSIAQLFCLPTFLIKREVDVSQINAGLKLLERK